MDRVTARFACGTSIPAPAETNSTLSRKCVASCVVIRVVSWIFASMETGLLVGETCPYAMVTSHSDTVCSGKDAAVLVWDRSTLKLHRAFRGHDGPVNSVGVQGNRLASASGDGKMILWDMNSGDRIRTFDAHDRGLACIEFKVCRLLMSRYNTH